MMMMMMIYSSRNLFAPLITFLPPISSRAGAPPGPGEVKGGRWGPLRQRRKAGDGMKSVPSHHALEQSMLPSGAFGDTEGGVDEEEGGRRDEDEGWLEQLLAEGGSQRAARSPAETTTAPSSQVVGDVEAKEVPAAGPIEDASLVTLVTPMHPDVFRIVDAVDASQLDELVMSVMQFAEVCIVRLLNHWESELVSF